MSGRPVAINDRVTRRFYGGSLDKSRVLKAEDSKGAAYLIMSPGTDGPRWFALQVRTRWESSTAVLLSGKGYQTLLPTYQTKKRWNGRLRQLNAPLFPGYVFCQFDALNRLPILVTPGVIAVVGRGRIPVPVEDAEIAAIQTVVSSGLRAEPWPYLEIGQKIRIESASLNGLEGVLIKFKGNHRIVVSVSLLRRSVALEIDRTCVSPLGPTRAPVLEPITSYPLQQGVVA
jgi:transcription antitermination factor NusG